jgi:hypothetical protein
VSPKPDQRAELRRITKQIAALGPVLPGSLLQRYLHCQNTGCRCHADPPQLHGPYWYWTRKVNAKTVSRVLSHEQAADYQPWFDNQRRLRELVHDLETVGIDIVDADPRTPKRR